MRHRQPPRPNLAPAPQDEVEIEHARRPMLARPPSEIPFQRLYGPQHLGRLQAALDQGHGIGEIAAGAADGRVEDDGGGVEQAELLFEAGDRRFDHARGAAVAAVRAVRADGDCVEVQSQSITIRPEFIEGLPFLYRRYEKDRASTSSARTV